MLKSKLRKLDVENRALKRRLTKSSIDTEDLSVEIAEIKTEENVARMWKSDPSNPANNATATVANPAGATPAVAQPTSQVSNVSNATNPANTTSNAAVNTASNTTLATAATTAAKTSVGENLEKEKTKSDVDEFEIQEDEILQYKNAMETDQMKKDLEKKLEIANNKVNLFKS